MLRFDARSPVFALFAATVMSASGGAVYAQSPLDSTAPAAQTAAVTHPHAAQSGANAAGATPETPNTSTPTQLGELAPIPADATDAAKQDASETAPPKVTHPVVASLLNKLSDTPELRNTTHKDDVAAILAYYTAEAAEPTWTARTDFTQSTKDAIAEIAKADDWGLKAADFELPNLNVSTFTTEAQAEAELRMAIVVLKYARYARGGRVRPSSVSRLFDQSPEIADPLTVLQSLATSSSVAKDLRDYHPKHPQFERLRQALLDLRRAEKEAASNAAKAKAANSAANAAADKPEVTAKADKKSKKKKHAKAKAKSKITALKLIANMERWRWVPRDLGSFYVWDDVPAQMTSVINKGEVVLHEKMVVGKPGTPTPMFSAPMQYIVFHPSWGVPPGMKRNELGPQLRNTGGGWFSSKPLASTVLKSHGLRVSRNGRPVDPDSVDWSSVNVSSYHFTQPPGPTNVLGIVKFRFPNKHHVYMHDTPERHLFNGRARTFSHGCMRVQNPMKLAEVLLKHDKGWEADRVKSARRRGENIELEKPIPVHVAYFTVDVDDNGKIDVHRDIYGLDNRTASKLEGRKVRVGGAAVAKTKRKTRSRRYARKKKRKPKKKPFNPFGSLVD